MRSRFKRAGWLLLAGGGLAAALVYFLAAPAEDRDVIGYSLEGGKAYAVTTDDSRRYEQDLERIGGKSAVMAADFNRWFASLWHGQKLAGTLVVLSLGGSLGCFYLAHLLTYPPPADAWP